MPPITRIDILYFDGCPNVTATVDKVRAVAARLGVEIDVYFVRVMSDADAERECFIGSPSVRVNGIDIDPSARGRFELGVSCRTYGGARVPPERMIAAALQGVATVPTSARVFLAAIASVIAAAVSSACRWLPLVLVVAGVSASGVALADALIEAVAHAGYSAVSETTSSPQQAVIPSTSVTVLSEDIKSLAKSFNAAASRHRFLAILSPT